ncbi:hypothetical protein PENSPDRAFT_187991 [Peniophora sp. CONT]|nr:hypothetical protein PENSPDRAFT_187991 [Peniophora sp. CONT]
MSYEDHFHVMENHNARRGPPRPVITVSHVSRRWRKIAISCQTLWSTSLPCGSLDWTLLCLARCSSASFDLAVSGLDLVESEEYRAAYEVVLPHLARVRSVAYDLDTEDLSYKRGSAPIALRRLFNKLSTTVMPLAKELQVFHFTEYQPLEDIPRLELTNTMPALETVFFNGIVYRPPCGHTIFPSTLRSLIMSDSNCWWTVDEMINILRTTPMLEWLDIEVYPQTFKHGMDSKTSSVYPPRCVRLSKLKKFICKSGTFVRNMLIFGYLAVPSNAELRLRLMHDTGNVELVSDSPELVTDLWPFIDAAVHAHFAPALDHAAFYPSVFLDKHSVSVEAKNGKLPWDPELPDGSIARHLLPELVTLEVPQVGDELNRHDNDPREPRPFHDQIFAMWLSLPIFTRARVIHLNPRFDRFSFDFLKRFTDVQSIHFHSLVMLRDHFCEMLVRENPNGTRALFPKLTTIHVGCERPSVYGRPPMDTDGNPMTLLARLACLLRSLWGSTFKHLVLHRSNALFNEHAAVALLKGILGADRVVCTDDGRSMDCCCYMPPIMPRRESEDEERPTERRDEEGSDESDDDDDDDDDGDGDGDHEDGDHQ